MIIPLSNEILDNFNLTNHEYLVEKDYYEDKSGVQEYRLYSYLSTFFNDTTILDIGTLYGRSAVALSHNNSNRVISYDIRNHINNYGHNLYLKRNIQFKIKNVLDDLNRELVSKLKIVMIDIDHYGSIEKKIMDKLRELGFKGLIILDDTTNHPDTTMNRCMKELWEGIPEKKYDLTKYGHWSGTGVVIMDDDIDFDII
jgi:predicted O-methyltransferase YrrM